MPLIKRSFQNVTYFLFISSFKTLSFVCCAHVFVGDWSCLSWGRGAQFHSEPFLPPLAVPVGQLAPLRLAHAEGSCLQSPRSYQRAA